MDDKVGMAIALEDLMGCGRVDLVALPEELFTLCSEKLGDLEQIRRAYVSWVEDAGASRR